MTYDRHFRMLVLSKVLEHGHRQIPQIALDHGVAERTIYYWFQMLEVTGDFHPHRQRARKGYSCIPPVHFQAVVERLEGEPMTYQYELCNLLENLFGLQYTVKQMQKALEDAGLTRKVLDLRAREQSAALRAIYMGFVCEHYTACQLVFFDESHCSPNDLRRKYGYAYHDQPAFVYAYNTAHGDGVACSALCALGLQGMLSFRMTTEPVDSPFFLETLQHDILPHMRPFPAPNSVLIMDNAGTHDHEDIFELCLEFGVLVLFLPPYSYDLSPIEISFHQAKQFVRSMFPHMNYENQIIAEHLAEGLNSVDMVKAIGAYLHCGYPVTENDVRNILALYPNNLVV